MSPEHPAPTVHVFYDYVCPYAYIGWERTKALERRFDVEFTFLPWEIHPTTDPAGEAYEHEPPEANVEWLERLAGEVDVDLDGPDVGVNSNLALRGAELARDRGAFRDYHEAAFQAVWQEGRNLGDEAVLRTVAGEAGLDPDAFLEAVRHPAYQARLDGVDRAAEALGVQRVPTFVFGDQRIVGNDPFDGSLVGPLEAFLERWKALGPDGTTEASWDVNLETLLHG